ncbi:MAG: hypothetical protein MRY78_00955 [Saprospiraceae bacterium]|nr:hypothetical protein [Saprospiraceae bacterium]
MKDQSKKRKKTWAQFGRALLLWVALLLLAAWNFGFLDSNETVISTSAEEIGYYQGTPVFWSNKHAITGANFRTEEYAKSGQYSVKLTPKNPYGLGYDIPMLRGNESIVVSVWRFAPDKQQANGKLVSQVFDSFWNGCEEVVETVDGWQKIQCTIDPPFSSKGKPLKIYCWNAGQSPVYFDDLNIKILRNN